MEVDCHLRKCWVRLTITQPPVEQVLGCDATVGQIAVDFITCRRRHFRLLIYNVAEFVALERRER